ncbi:acetyl-CoA carboxylase biotin carboxyl carrier protein [Acidocella sp. KAb 2-4]|uniref:acetyl-CoA carboxylase biotin carboxyl carrier protein n=1 Tax=Acidocella sp. KAb 2-4 TaxID=2885158 RepID=UPI001D079E09|nr:acetyl-CoA carboxylase biotin carboxyl carrier protein [Acidocella sp. KAb 2-4]MCB5945010.1 acetyl-CoA carboxylase biotin carboxyl carrier protein [Acidocella sp. KAb 2-4]
MSLSFDPKTLAELAALLNETGLSEIELAEGDRKVRLARAITQVTMPIAAPAALAAAPAPAAAAAAAPVAAPADLSKHPGVVKSPMVGVAYLSAEPGAAPYVTVGQNIEAGATLLLVEAMKTFNQIKAPRAGVVKQILVATGAPVEFDEPLMIIE